MSEEAPKPFWHPSLRRNNLNGENAAIPGAFYNDRDPAIEYASEKPIHRRIAELHLQGFTNVEIAAMINRTTVCVTNVLRQPFIRKYLVENVKRNVQDELKEFLDAELMPSLKTLKNIRDDATAKPSDRAAAAKELVDRRLGRAVQPFQNNDKPVTELTQDELAEEVNRVLNKLNAQSSGN